MGGSLVVVGFNHWLLTRRRYTTVGGKASYGEALDLGKWKGVLFVICILFFAVTSLFPLMTLLGTSLLKSYAVGWRFGNFGFSKYLYVLRDLEITRHALINSTLLAVCCATLGTAAGFFAAYFEIRERKRGGQILQSLVTLPYATPGIVVAVAMILAFSGQFGLNLYNTLWILGAAYFAKYLNFSARSIAAALVQVDISLEEAGWMCGAGWLRSIRDILLPAVKPALIGSWFLIFMPVFSELTMSILLYGPGTETVGTVLFELQNYADPQAGAVLAMVVVVLVLTSNGLVKWATEGKYGF
ncbi:MAG: iron ABC transporter permease, partial [Deltaproteobacteria bacterium]|nr:iron ABC transporter permease [Deltaproteobacteria bacterium]